ncbi:two-component response regulator [Methylophaga lonarensis MPL]|uniref:Two-component response regulator n=1 Tax=Methylophaga lonarensis MPL TaxID=1286106 RepID=M7PFS9_9GAMM|nr:response regulator transcription factor [Methylophaga lonarensis]EMR12750.1 two-component response regulator [Methylophaga lonarensis MPL]
MTRTLLIEDDLDLAQTVIDYLQLEQIDCDHASNGVAGLNLLTDNDYDVLLLDLNLPRLDGLGVCEKLRQEGRDIPILMLTARDQVDDKISGFHAGTDDYLVKPFALEELVVRIDALSRRRSGQVQLLSYADLQMNLKQRTAMRAGSPLKLSPSGWQLLECLLRAAPEVVPRYKLEQSVWGETTPDSNSLKVHLHHLRKAVDGAFSPPLIHTIAGHGVTLRKLDDETTAQP